MRAVIIIFLLFVICSCSDKRVSIDDISYVKINTWIWDKGFKIGQGEFISFDSDSSVFQLKNDTIYYRTIPKAIIRKIERKYYELIVSSIDGKTSGVYINIEEFTR